MENGRSNGLKETYISISEGISNIESFLPRVESDDMTYDLNRQLQDYYRMASLCQTELQRQGEELEDDLGKGSIQSNISKESNAQVGYESDNSTDQMIAQNMVDDIRRRVDRVRKYTYNSSRNVVSSIAMEIVKEEENHMEWMKSYVD